MEKIWDNSLSTLINSHPQAFLDLILPGAQCLHHHRNKLKGTQRQPDAVLEVYRFTETFIFNPEFQSYQDTKMVKRLLLYHVLLWSEYEQSVRSCVVSLWKQAKVDPSPLLWTQPGEPSGKKAERLRFCYETIEMWQIHYQVLLDLNHVVLYPLLPLTKEGATRKVVSQMLDLLSEKQHRDFAFIGFTFATRMFHQLKQGSDLEWLEKRFHHMHDILRDSPIYAWILAEGREEGKAEGREEGKAEGYEEGKAQMRQAIVDIVQERFPALAQLAEEVVAMINDFVQLRRLLVKLGSTQSAEQVHQLLLDLMQ